MWAAPAAADVTISGTVRYWDPIANGYRPARQVEVIVRGDWWSANPKTTTDDQGRYSVTVDDPKGLKTRFNNVRVQAYAQTRGLIQVYAFFLAPKPYNAVSTGVDGIRGGQSRTVNLWIGGNQDNVGRTPWGSTEATAAAFVIHREMQDHHRDLRGRAFTADDFDERGGERVGGVEVIVPAWTSVASYYNTATGFVNLIPGGDWPGVEAIGNDRFLEPTTISFFLSTVRHEYSHAIHDEMTGGAVLTGLTLPTVHAPDRQAAYPAVAFTEGWASFLPLVTLGTGGRFEPTPVDGPGLGIPASDPPGGHHDWEGEFTALLWDLFDPVGTETVRHPATTTANGGDPVPVEIVDAQEWTDGIEDSDLSRIRRAVREKLPVGAGLQGPTGATPRQVQWVSHFLFNYARLYGGDLHELKAIAFNRDLRIPGERERAARVEVVEMDHVNLLHYRFDVVEPDPEDRSRVKVSVWYRRAGRPLVKHRDYELRAGWRGDRREVEASFDYPGRGGSGDELWVLVNDGMLPTVYRFDVPEFDASMLAELIDNPIVDLPTGGEIDPHAGRRDRPRIPVDKDAVEEAAERARRHEQLRGIDRPVIVEDRIRTTVLDRPGDRLSDRRHLLQSLDRETVLELREKIEHLLWELEQREERRELLDRQRRMLYDVAIETGLDPFAQPKRLFEVDRGPVLSGGERPDLKEVLSGTRPRIAEASGFLAAYDRWLERAAAGGLDLDALEAPGDVREAAAIQRTKLREAIEREEASSDEILRLTTEIQRTIAEIDVPLIEPLEADLESLRRAAADVGEVIERPNEFLERAREMDAVLGRLRR